MRDTDDQNPAPSFAPLTASCCACCDLWGCLRARLSHDLDSTISVEYVGRFFFFFFWSQKWGGQNSYFRKWGGHVPPVPPVIDAYGHHALKESPSSQKQTEWAVVLTLLIDLILDCTHATLRFFVLVLAVFTYSMSTVLSNECFLWSSCVPKMWLGFAVFS